MARVSTAGETITDIVGMGKVLRGDRRGLRYYTDPSSGRTFTMNSAGAFETPYGGFHLQGHDREGGVLPVGVQI